MTETLIRIAMGVFTALSFVVVSLGLVIVTIMMSEALTGIDIMSKLHVIFGALL
jgi:hypothetical protein